MTEWKELLLIASEYSKEKIDDGPFTGIEKVFMATIIMDAWMAGYKFHKEFSSGLGDHNAG